MPASGTSSVESGAWELSQPDAASLDALLGLLADCEMEFSENFYVLFFERRPDARKLFGRFAIAEQEEMIRETLRSVHALHDGEGWLDANLSALGRSHLEYGVTDDMYDAFVDSAVECARNQFGEAASEDQLQLLRQALASISGVMRRAARDAESSKTAPSPEKPG